MPKRLPLDGLFVADFSRVLAGPLCTMMLADAGARVIKIEEPGRGDETRRWGPPFVEGESAYFLSINRGKESVTIDLRSREGKAIARKLIERADVVVDNFRPDQRRALGVDRVRRINRRAIHCTIAGFDDDTPDASVPGYDLLAQAAAGLMSITGDESPTKVGVAVSDVLTAHYAYGAITTALVARDRTGRGESIDISLFGATLASLVNVAQSFLLTGREPKRWGNAHPSIVPYQSFHAKDRDFIVAVGTDRQFASLCASVIARPELATDDRFATNAARVVNRNALIVILSEIFAAKTARSWVARCRRFDIPSAVVEGVRGAIDRAGGLVGTLGHPVVGEYRVVGSPVQFGGERLPLSTPPPRLGEHTDRVLKELGYTALEIRELRTSRAV